MEEQAHASFSRPEFGDDCFLSTYDMERANVCYAVGIPCRSCSKVLLKIYSEAIPQLTYSQVDP